MKPNFKGICKLAVKTWRRVGILYIIGIVLSTFCLTSALNSHFAIKAEKDKPLTLAATSSSITNESIHAIGEIENVVSVTGIIDVSAMISIGEYSASLVINGIDPSFLENEYVFESGIPENSSMPYIAINEAALSSFVDKEGTPVKEGETLDLDAQTSISAEKSMAAKVCAVLKDESLEPKAYMSLSSAKDVLAYFGQPSPYTSVMLSIKDAGSEEDVISALSELGYSAQLTDPLKLDEWDKKETQIIYLLILGILGSMISLIISVKNEKLDFIKNGSQYDIINVISNKKRKHIWNLRCAFCTLIGLLIGAVIVLSLPSFLSNESRETSIFSCSFNIIGFIIVFAFNLLLSVFPRPKKDFC